MAHGQRRGPRAGLGKNPPKDFDLCIEPQDWPGCALILAASGATPKGHTRFGGMRYEEANNRFDVWVSTLAQTAARSSHGKYRAIHLISGVQLTYVR